MSRLFSEVRKPEETFLNFIFMRKISLFLFVVLIPIVLGTNSCSVSEECMKSLCDLTTSIAVATGSSVVIPAGSAFTFVNVIKNASDAYSKCGTEISKLTNTNINVKYKTNLKNGNGDEYKVIFNKDEYAVPQIEPDKKANEEYEIPFNEPGEYLIVTNADNRNTTQERNENNNLSPALGAGTGKKTLSKEEIGIKVIVLPNPNYKKKLNEPMLEVRRKSVTITD